MNESKRRTRSITRTTSKRRRAGSRWNKPKYYWSRKKWRAAHFEI